MTNLHAFLTSPATLFEDPPKRSSPISESPSKDSCSWSWVSYFSWWGDCWHLHGYIFTLKHKDISLPDLLLKVSSRWLGIGCTHRQALPTSNKICTSLCWFQGVACFVWCCDAIWGKMYETILLIGVRFYLLLLLVLLRFQGRFLVGLALEGYHVLALLNGGRVTMMRVISSLHNYFFIFKSKL